jgi:hypothetical protein
VRIRCSPLSSWPAFIVLLFSLVLLLELIAN